jgi:hypothetical protein
MKVLQRANYNKMKSLPHISNPALAGLELVGAKWRSRLSGAAGSFNSHPKVTGTTAGSQVLDLSYGLPPSGSRAISNPQSEIRNQGCIYWYGLCTEICGTDPGLARLFHE